MSTQQARHLPPAPSGASRTILQASRPAPQPSESLPLERLVYEEELPGGAMWSWTLKRGQVLRLTDLEGCANVGFVCYNRQDYLDRYNMADTLKAQHTARLSTGYVLLSDMGRALLSVIGDTCGWHDPLGGHANAAQVAAKYGPSRFQEERNAYKRNAHDCFLVELGKHGLGRRDLVANINFFSRLSADAEGRLSFVPGNSQPGALVDLRAELDVLVVLNTCPHPMDTESVWRPGRVRATVWRADPPAEDDYCRLFRPENERAFFNSEILFR
jgi:uncharacterized protein